MSRWPDRTVQERFEEKFLKTDGCWDWLANKDSCGYGKFKVSGKLCSAHRVAYTLYVGEIPEGLYVCHKCDNPGCVNPSHLFLGTQTDNMRDCFAKNRMVRQPVYGERHGSAKLTKDQVVEIRERRGKGESLSSLAIEFGVAFQTISDIYLHKSWARM